VSELAPTYDGRVDFVIISAEDTAQRGDEIEAFGFTELRHGMVGFTTEGDPLVKMPGHNFGKAEIQEAATQLLASDA
jgi:hypothetical protein